MAGVFVIGTDTMVGKTFISAALIHIFQQKGHRVGGMKPFESGNDEPSDAEILWHATGNDGSPPSYTHPYHFKAPLAPAIAAKKETRNIDLKEIDSAYAKVQKNSDFFLVEGCGGLLVPLLPDHLDFTVESLALRLNLSLLIIARAKLGTLNHTLLTLYRCRQVGLKVKGVLLNQAEKLSKHDPSLCQNAQDLRSLTKTPIWGPLPFNPEFPLGLLANPISLPENIRRILEPLADGLFKTP